MEKDKQVRFEFSKKLKQLEEITSSLEQEGADLEVGINNFDAGMKLVVELRNYLNEAEGRVEAIKQKYDKVPEEMAKLDL
jgi:exodeoxyribonuclease VII small subunit